MKALTKRGIIKLGNATFDVYVLEDGKRVCTQRSLIRALGGPGNGKLPSLIGQKPYRSLDLGATIRFETLDGVQAIGREVSDIGKLCAQIIDAQINGTLPTEKIDLARAANRLNGALANVGLEALVDEATDYQSVREGEFLRKRLQAFLRTEADEWKRRFGAKLAQAICKRYGHAYDGGRQPRFLSSIFSKIYRTVLGDDVAKELRGLNPNPCRGNNHYQHLTDSIQSLLETDLIVIEAMARTSGSPAEFWGRLNAHFRRSPFQLGFNIQ